MIERCGGNTSVYISYNHLCSLVGEQAGGFGADALACAGDDGDLVGEQAVGVVQVGGYLRKTVHLFSFFFFLLCFFWGCVVCVSVVVV